MLRICTFLGPCCFQSNFHLGKHILCLHFSDWARDIVDKNVALENVWRKVVVARRSNPIVLVLVLDEGKVTERIEVQKNTCSEEP